jgi:hypothetical protein
MNLLQYQVVPIFEDWENESNLIGSAILLKRRRNGLPFILKDTYSLVRPDTVSFYNQPVTKWIEVNMPLEKYNLYSYQKWDVKIIRSNNPRYQPGKIYTINIRYFIKQVNDLEVKSREHFKDELTEEEYIKLCLKKNKMIDKFMKIDGVELF